MTLTTNQNGRLVMIAVTKAETEDTKMKMTMNDWIPIWALSALLGLIFGTVWALL